MSDGVEVRILRSDALFAKMRRLAPATDREVIKAVERGAQEVASLAQQLAPSRTGKLRRSIGWQMDPARINIVALVYADAFYGRWVEFGTRSGLFGPQAARPFMFPAYRLLKKRTTNRIGRALSKAARDVANKS